MRFPRVLAALAMAASAAHAGSPRALVIGNGAYAFLPPLPGCPASAKLVASALRRGGFEVTEKTDLSSGAMQAALGGFTNEAAGGPSVIYICAYASGFNDRAFLLPVSASLTRPPDVLAQGVLAKSVVDAASGAGVVVLDTVSPPPGAATKLEFGILNSMIPPAGLGVAAVTETAMGDGPTPIAKALNAALKGPGIAVADLFASLTTQPPPAGGARIAVLRAPTPTPPVAAPTRPAPPPQPAAPPPAPVPAPAPAAAAIPDEAHLSDAERRRVQIDLAQLGYYDGRIDGEFGPDTRAAIRRFQYELKSDMTGILTQEQTARLLK